MIVKNKKSHIQHYVGLTKCPLAPLGNGECKSNYFYWEFNAKPSTFSKIYRVLLIWDFKLLSPKVFILNDELHQISKSRNIPHLYDRDKIQLCLHYPSFKEFRADMPLCLSLIPWTYLWLSYYEEWLFSDEWKGGGKHPEVKKSKRKKSFSKRFRTLKRPKVLKQDLTTKIYQKRKNNFDKK